MVTNKLKSFCYLITFYICIIGSLNAQLKDNSNQCDYLIITPAQFVNTLQTFVNWRQQSGLSVKVIETQQIFSEFPDTIPSHSIRSFVSFALTNWSDPKPQYLLLVGGVKLLPSFRIESTFSNSPIHKEDSVSIDEWYSANQFASDEKPDIALGRFPVNNEDELNNIITKTINYEDSLSFNDYPKDFLFLTDKTDSSIFESSVNSFINRYLPDNYSYKTIFAGQDSTIEVTRNNLFNQLSEGTIFLCYYGHGASYKWSKYDIFTLNDIDSLKSHILPFIYTSDACSQSFDLPDDSSIVRKLIVLPKSGAVASIASTGLSIISAGGDQFLSHFYNYIFTNQNISIGKALLKAKNFYSSSSPDGISRRYTLLGDPAFKIPTKDIVNIVDEPIEIQSIYSLKQNYPNPFNPKTKIKYQISINDNVKLILYDLLGRMIKILDEGFKYFGSYEVEFDGSDYSSGVYIYRLITSEGVLSKKMLLLK